MREWVRRVLWEPVPRDHRQSAAAFRRRRLVTLVFVGIGAGVLGLSLRLEPGSPWFYPATIGLAGVWTVGAFASGPLHLGRIAVRDELRRPIATPIALGLGLAVVFVLGALVVREVPALESLEGLVRNVLDFADQGSLPLLIGITAINGVAEELFFRGAVYAAITRYQVVITIVAYTLATLATGNVMLVFAAVLLGALCGLQRRASGGILAPVLTHLSWSIPMLLILPLVFGPGA